jgi:hypothetical protein
MYRLWPTSITGLNLFKQYFLRPVNSTIIVFIPRLEKYKYPIDEDYQHFLDCETRKQGKLNECGRCKYVWSHWYGTDIPYDMDSYH